jgi:hypothetical protein
VLHTIDEPVVVRVTFGVEAHPGEALARLTLFRLFADVAERPTRRLETASDRWGEEQQ